METIVEIRDYEGKPNGWGSEGGYHVVTTEQVITLAIDNQSSCCESWGYFWCNDNPQDFIGAELLAVEIVDQALNTKRIVSEGADSLDCGGIMFVNLKTNNGVLQFVAYNCHNGYYGHEARVESQQLKTETVL